jgi:amino acid adenylation domain-containing protein
LRTKATAVRTTLFTVLLAGYWTMLARLCRQTDFGIGLPVTGRDTLARQEAIGFFVDTVVVRIDTGADISGEALIVTTREAVKRGLAHRALPFEMIVERLGPSRDLGLNPFFQTGFQFMEFFAAESSEEILVPRSSAIFDLGLDLWSEHEVIAGRLEYNSDLFDRETISTMVETFCAALRWLCDADRPLTEFRLGEALPSGHRSILRGPDLSIEAPTVIELFEAAAERHPEAIALEGDGGAISYAELRAETEALAGALSRRGLLPGDTVALAVDRSPDLTRLILAALRAGAAFACLDPAWPEPRRQAVLADLAPALVVDSDLSSALRSEALAGLSAPRRPHADDRAYVIFTSGSTGAPKGVEVIHRGLANVALAQRLVFGLCPGRRVVQLSSPTFDASVFETVLALTAGATLVVAPAGVLAGAELADFMDEARVDVVVTPPSILATLPEGRGRSLRLVSVAGESCPADLARRFSATAEFHNLYGPTEATIWATSGRRAEGARIAIGAPIANTTTFVMDERLDVLPVGVAGELCIAGPGLARGYLNRPDLTAERFPAHASSAGSRIYRSGDLVRQTRAGDLVFLGRVDRQVKVRGLRIELEEIEVALRAAPHVVDAIAETVEVGGQAIVVAYLQLAAGRTEDILESCRDALRGRLPTYMMPSRFVAVDGFARTASGKIDRKALPEIDDGTEDGPKHVPPATPTEISVAQIVAHILKIARAGANDNFFHIGGHSLAAVQLAARASSIFSLKVTVADIFAHPTVKALAAMIDSSSAERSERTEDEAPLVRLPRGSPELQL